MASFARARGGWGLPGGGPRRYVDFMSSGTTDAAESLRAAKNAALAVRGAAYGSLLVTGPDAVSWLNGLVTCDLATMRPMEMPADVRAQIEAHRDLAAEKALDASAPSAGRPS